MAAATRAGAFREIAAAGISQGLGGPLSQIGLGLVGIGAPGLAIGFVIGQSSGTFPLFSRVILRSPGVPAAISWLALIAISGWRGFRPAPHDRFRLRSTHPTATTATT